MENAEDARGKEIEAKEALENKRLMAADLFEKVDLDICYYLIFAKDLQCNMKNHETRVTTLTSYLYPRSSTISSTSRPLQAGVTPSVQPSRMRSATSCTVRSLMVLQIFRQASLQSCLASLQIPACSKIDSRSNIIVQFPENRSPPISQRDFH